MDKGRLEGINGGMVENGSHLAIDHHRCDTVQGLLALEEIVWPVMTF